MTEQDPMDQRLREYADRWRASSPSPVALDADRLPARSTGRTWWVAGIAAAAVVAGITLGTTLVGHDGGATPPKPAHTVKPGDVVPWAPLPATRVTIPVQTVPASPDPAEANGKPECRAADLRAENNGLDGAAGTIYLNVRLVLVGSTPCRLEGWPKIEPMDQGHRVAIPVTRTTDSSVYRHPVLVAPGRPAVLVLAWASNWCTTPVHNDTIRMPAPGGYVSFPGFGGSPYCNGVAGSGPTPIMVQPFRPEKTRPERVRSAYGQLEVSGDLQLTSAPNRQVHFTVTLTSPSDLSLDPCPNYRIAEFGGGHDSDTSYGLNCDAVPYRDSAGRPYLPAGTPVRFDMVAHAGDQSVPKLIWELDVPERDKALGGQITVAASAPATTVTRDDALRTALAADPAVRKEVLGGLEPRGPVVCGIHVLGSSPDGGTLYLWLSCSDYVVADGVATAQTGSHEPAVVRLRGEGPDIGLEKVTFPRQQSLQSDINRLFPPSIAAHIYDEASTRTSPSPKELEAEALALAGQ